MRVFKKIMYIVLAFVPILPLLLFAVCNIGNVNGVEIMPFGSFAVANADVTGEPVDEDQRAIFVEKDTILFHVLSSVIPSNDHIYTQDFRILDGDFAQSRTGLPAGEYLLYINESEFGQARFFERICSIYEWFVSVGITPPTYSVFIFAYLFYMLFIHVSFMIFDIIVFVPKKISEMLEV